MKLDAVVAVVVVDRCTIGRCLCQQSRVFHTFSDTEHVRVSLVNYIFKLGRAAVYAQSTINPARPPRGISAVEQLHSS